MVPRHKLSYEVQQKLQTMLLNNEFAVGDYLPSEQQLAEQFNVSRTTIRDAISSLVEKGFVERRHGKGICVVNNSSSVAADSLRLLMFRNDYTVDELIETRRIIECQVARLTAQRANEEQLSEIQHWIDLMLQPGLNDIKYAQYDMRFHQCLAKFCGNKILIAVMEALGPLLCKMIENVVKKGGQCERDAGYHAKILSALRDHDPDEAERRVGIHLDETYKIFHADFNEQINYWAINH
jgi:GntR family transcriptional repressor for pyruvate dehydrogenase complex